jgi:predicted DNA-binding transcriptional regulator AlpA
MKRPLLIKPKARYTNLDNLPLVLTVDDISAILRISRAGAYKLANQPDFPKLTIGKRVLVNKADFIQWLQQKTA